jgi:dihydrofolate synthase/folylpolyglutamate synthase
MDILGQTLGKVAVEKAGIIKKKVPVIIGETHQETRSIFTGRAAELSSEIFFADDCYECIPDEFDLNKGIRKYRMRDIRNGNINEGETVLGGDYQVKNLVTVHCAAEVLKYFFNISHENIKDGIRKVVNNTGLNGRWQILGYNPLIICDTGHNREGLEYVIHQINTIQKSKLHFIIGFVNDKDLDSVLPLFPKDALYYFTKASIPRALDEKILMSEALKYNIKGSSYPSVMQALKAAKSNAETTDMIFVGGSTFVVAEVV